MDAKVQGAGAGALIGAAAGSMIMPGWGTAIGAVAGGLLGAFSAKSSSNSKAKELQYKAGIARINAQIARQNADWTRRAGEVGAQQKGMEGRFRLGQTKVIQSGKGLDVNTGSNAAVQEAEHEISQYDQSMIRSNAAHRAYGFETEAVGKEAEAGLLDMGVESVNTAGNYAAASSILGGATSVADKWMQYNTTFGGSSNPVNVVYDTSFGSS